MSFVINENLVVDHTNYTLKNIIDKPYGTLRFKKFTISDSATTKTGYITLTTSGRPVFAICTGDLNPGTGTDWCRFTIARDGTTLRTVLDQGNANSYNKPFSISCLDDVSAGKHTYSITFTQGRGTSVFGEDGDMQAPVFTVFEV